MKKKNFLLADIQVIAALTRGAFGRVFLVQPKKTIRRNKSNNCLGENENANANEKPGSDLYVMKVLNRTDVFDAKVRKRVMAECRILEELSFERVPFIVQLVNSFVTETNFYLISEFQPGGDLSSLLKRYYAFDEYAARQYIAETILAVEFLHMHNILIG
jgi:serine/threonine protein kinase